MADRLEEAWAAIEEPMKNYAYATIKSKVTRAQYTAGVDAGLGLLADAIRYLAVAVLDEVFKHKHTHDERCGVDAWCPKAALCQRIEQLGREPGG